MAKQVKSNVNQAKRNRREFTNVINKCDMIDEIGREKLPKDLAGVVSEKALELVDTLFTGKAYERHKLSGVELLAYAIARRAMALVAARSPDFGQLKQSCMPKNNRLSFGKLSMQDLTEEIMVRAGEMVESVKKGKVSSNHDLRGVELLANRVAWYVLDNGAVRLGRMIGFNFDEVVRKVANGIIAKGVVTPAQSNSKAVNKEITIRAKQILKGIFNGNVSVQHQNPVIEFTASVIAQRVAEDWAYEVASIKGIKLNNLQYAAISQYISSC